MRFSRLQNHLHPRFPFYKLLNALRRAIDKHSMHKTVVLRVKWAHT